MVSSSVHQVHNFMNFKFPLCPVPCIPCWMSMVERKSSLKWNSVSSFSSVFLHLAFSQCYAVPSSSSSRSYFSIMSVDTIISHHPHIHHNCHHRHHDHQFAQSVKAFARKQRWSFPQPCSLFSSHSPLSLPNLLVMTQQPEDQGRGAWRRGESRLWRIETDNLDQSVHRVILSVREAIHWVPAILVQWMSLKAEHLVRHGQ